MAKPFPVDSSPNLAQSIASRSASPYDRSGMAVPSGRRRTYRAATVVAFAAAAGTAPFFLLYGSTTGYTTIRVQRLIVSGPTLTAVAYHSINLVKYSTVASGGTSTALVQTPLDSLDGIATASLCSVYTAAPTAGTLVGTLSSRRHLAEATTAVAAAQPPTIEFDLRGTGDDDTDRVLLRSSSEGIGLLFPAAPASAVTIAFEVEWTEEP